MTAVDLSAYNSHELVEKIRRKDRSTLQSIYTDGYPMVKKYVTSNSGSEEDAKDIFQDAIYLLFVKSQSDHFELSSKPSTFLFGVAKNLWLKKLGRPVIDPETLAHEKQIAIAPQEEEELLTAKSVHQHITLLGEPCQTIITQFYFYKTSMKEIAQMLRYTNANNAKNQKYKCFMRLKKNILSAVQK